MEKHCRNFDACQLWRNVMRLPDMFNCSDLLEIIQYKVFTKNYEVPLYGSSNMWFNYHTWTCTRSLITFIGMCLCIRDIFSSLCHSSFHALCFYWYCISKHHIIISEVWYTIILFKLPLLVFHIDIATYLHSKGIYVHTLYKYQISNVFQCTRFPTDSNRWPAGSQRVVYLGSRWCFSTAWDFKSEELNFQDSRNKL